MQDWSQVFQHIVVQKRQSKVIDLSTGATPAPPGEFIRAALAAFRESGSNLTSMVSSWGELGALDGDPLLLKALEKEVPPGERIIVTGITAALRYFQLWQYAGLPSQPAARPRPGSFFPLGYDFFGMRSPFGLAGYAGLYGRSYDQKTGTWDLSFQLQPGPFQEVGAIYLSSPHCPTGRIWSEKEARLLVSIAQAQDIPLIVDRAEAPPWLTGRDAFDAIQSNALVQLFSFKHGLIGERIGVVVGSARYLDVLREWHRQFLIQTPASGRLAALSALHYWKTHPGEALHWREALRSRAMLCQEVLTDARLQEAGICLARWCGGPSLWVWWKGQPSSSAVFHELLQHGVAVGPGSVFRLAPLPEPIDGLRIGIGGVGEDLLLDGVQTIADVLLRLRTLSKQH